MASYIGIDLGTSFSAVSYIDETGRPTIVHNSDGVNITPSCVLFEDDRVIVGEIAKRQWGVSSKSVAARFKREMGTSIRYNIAGQSLTPTALSAFVLKKLKQDTETAIGNIAEVVVTIPANFSNEAREATMEAARIAGLNVKYIINEPTAAALYYAFKKGTELHGIFAVYDLGGGTFDVSLIQVHGQEINVLASNGVNKLGGDDFDSALQKIVADKYKRIAGRTLTLSEYSKNDAELDKKSLSKRAALSIQLPDHIVEVSRREFEASISALVAQAEMVCEATMDEAKVKHADLQGVFLVGGSTRVPCVNESVRKVFKQEPIATVNVDEVVALGASLYAAYKGDKKDLSSVQKTAVSTIKFSEITNFCFGTITLDMDEQRKAKVTRNAILISKNTKIPCSITESFYTVHDGQESVSCEVTQSISPESDPRFVKIIWTGKLPLPSGRPANQEIKITFEYDENNMMKCSFVDVGTGKRTAVDLSPSDSATSEQSIDKFLVE